MSGIVDDLLEDVDDILGIRQDLGAQIKDTYFYTRSWSQKPGVGDPIISKEKMDPSPRVVEFSDDLRIKEGGAVRQGDILLKMVSKHSYPNRFVLEAGNDPKVERLYEVGGKLYVPVSVKEKHLVYSILLRPKSNTRSE